MKPLLRLLLLVLLFVCDVLSETTSGSVQTESGSRSQDLRIQWSRIPAIETYYVCQQFKVPVDRPYHIDRFEAFVHSTGTVHHMLSFDSENRNEYKKVPADRAYHVDRFEALVNNTGTVHHMLLFGCNFDMENTLPHPCDSLDNRCRTWLVKWDMGMEVGIDMPEDTGVRFGQGSFQYMLLQVHWNNPHKLDTMTDNSGFRIHYTDQLKKYDVGNVQLGQNSITIPPWSRDVVVSGACVSDCTGLMLARSVYVSHVYLHMHGLGVRASLDVYRDREVIDRLVLEEDYNYTAPIVHRMSPVARIDRGDEVRLTCWYDSYTGERLRNQTIKYGQGSQAEMCYAFVRYYPDQLGFHQCLQDGDKNVNC